jgi:hypothetical protein
MEIARKVNIVRMLLELLSLPDVPTLLQLMRLLQACFWDLRNAEVNTVSSGTPVEQSVLQENRAKNVSKSEVVTKHSELDVSPSFRLTVDDEAHESCSTVANVKQLKRADNLCEKKSVEHHPLGEVSHLENCAVELELSRLNSWTLRESSHKEISQTVESLVMEADQVDCEDENVSDRRKDEQLQLKEEANKEKTAVDSVWLQELCDVNKWLPSIIFILRSSTNGKFLCVLSIFLISKTTKWIFMKFGIGDLHRKLCKFHISRVQLLEVQIELF